MESVDPHKYIVMKREDLMEFIGSFAAAQDEFDTQLFVTGVHLRELEDAVVIRRQDLFAGPALHSYSNNMAMAARMLVASGVAEGDERKHLIAVADYFHEQAVLADAEGWKTPD